MIESLGYHKSIITFTYPWQSIIYIGRSPTGFLKLFKGIGEIINSTLENDDDTDKTKMKAAIHPRPEGRGFLAENG
jgi:hypothetical protein